MDGADGATEARKDGAAPPAGGIAGPGRRRRRWPAAAVIFGGLVLGVAVLLSLLDWNMLRGPISRYASARLHRPVRILGDLRVHLLTWTPEVDVRGLQIGEPKGGPKPDLADLDRLIVRVRLLPLLTGRVVMPLLEIDHARFDFERDAAGRENWRFSPPKPNAPPLRLPPIQNFVLRDARIRFSDARRRLLVAGVADSNESGTGAARHAFSLRGEGSINAEPFRLLVLGGPLLHVALDKPYPFHVDVTAGPTRILADGALKKPFDTSAFTARLQASGENLARLYQITNLALPNSPPYQVSGRLERNGNRFTLSGAAGRFGSSDLEGGMVVTVVNHRPDVDATLRSARLNLKDLAIVLGAKPAPTAPRPATDRGLLLSDAPYNVRRLRSLDARLDYRAASVQAGFLPMRGVDLRLGLKDGVLRLDPLSFGFPQGQVLARLTLDANPVPPLTRVDIGVSNLNADELVPRTGGAPPAVEGPLAARFKLEGRGASLHQAASHANGAVTFVLPGGRIRQAFAELLGVNAGKGLALLLSKNQGQTGVRCAVADFGVSDGVMRSRRTVFDTDVVKVTGSGEVNLGTERLDLVLKGETKRFRIGHVFLPITVTGDLLHPSFGVQPAPAAMQGAAAVALGVVLTPLAAILPFVDPGLARNADCSALLADAKTSPAPITRAQLRAGTPAPARR